MKRLTTQSFCLVAVLALLAGGSALADSPISRAPAAPIDTVVHFLDAPFGEGSPMTLVAEIEWDGGKVSFVDETIGHVFGFGLLEQGNADLSPFYEQGASALEIFLALAPEGTEVPDVLLRAHELARELDPGVPAEPRRFQTDLGKQGLLSSGGGPDKAISYYTFDKDTNICWNWSGTTNYDPVVGNDAGHDSVDVWNAFRAWTGISWVVGETANGTFYDEIAELSDQYYATPWGNERGFAMCVPYALVQPEESLFECTVPDGVFENTVFYRLYLHGQDSGSSWFGGPVDLTGYGQGARYKSSSSAERKYTLEVRDYSKKSSICKERYEVFWRNRNIGSGRPGGITL